MWPQGRPMSIPNGVGELGIALVSLQAKESSSTSLSVCSETLCSPSGALGISWFHSSFSRGVRHRLVLKRRTPPLLSSGQGWLLKPIVLNKGNQAFCGVLRENLGLLSRPCRKRRASYVDVGGNLMVFSRAATRPVAFLSSYDGELREPLLCPQGSPVPTRAARMARDVCRYMAVESEFKTC